MPPCFSFVMTILNFAPLVVLILVANLSDVFAGKVGPWSCTLLVVYALVISLVLCLTGVCYKINRIPTSGVPYRRRIIGFEEQKIPSLEFIVTYVLPMISFDCCTVKGLLQIVSLVVIVGLMYARHHHWKGNLILELMGYSFYICKMTDVEGAEYNEVVCVRGCMEGSKGRELTLYKINNQMNFVKPAVLVR